MRSDLLLSLLKESPKVLTPQQCRIGLVQLSPGLRHQIPGDALDAVARHIDHRSIGRRPRSLSSVEGPSARRGAVDGLLIPRAGPHVALVNRLGEPGGRALREAAGKDKAYHSIDLKPVEIAMQRGVLQLLRRGHRGVQGRLP